MTQLLARTEGSNRVAVSATTAGLHYRVWLHQVRGSGTAKATISCKSGASGVGATGTVTSFRFGVASGGWHEVWRYLGSRCTLEVTVSGGGALAVELRGR